MYSESCPYANWWAGLGQNHVTILDGLLWMVRDGAGESKGSCAAIVMMRWTTVTVATWAIQQSWLSSSDGSVNGMRETVKNRIKGMQFSFLG